MTTLTVKIRGNDHSPRECGIEINGPRYSVEDLDEITSREEAEAAGIPTALLNEYRGIWGLFGIWLEDRAVWGGPKTPAADLQEFGSSAEFVGKETGRRLGSGSTGGFPLPPSPSLRPHFSGAERRRRWEGRLEFTSKKGSFPSLDF